LLRRAIPAGSVICVMDEQAVSKRHPNLQRLRGWRDQGAGRTCGLSWRADGDDKELTPRGDHALLFGKMVDRI